MMNQAGVPPVSEILIRSAWYRLGYMSKTEKLYLSELHFCTSFIVPNLPCFFYGSSGEGISFRWNHNLSWKVRFLLGKRTEKIGSNGVSINGISNSGKFIDRGSK